MKREVARLRPNLNLDDQEHAGALLSKLDRLISNQIVVADDAISEQDIQPGEQAA